MAEWKFKTEAELVAAGYKRRNEAVCKGRHCGRKIWWWTTPDKRDDGKRKVIALDPDLQPHFLACPDSESFRTGQARSEKPPAGTPIRTFAEALKALARDQQAQAAISCINSLLVAKGVYSRAEFEQRFVEWAEKRRQGANNT